jgi:hypothetical protein
MKLNKMQRAYIAGILDGEGYIFFRRRKSDPGVFKWYCGIQLNISNREIIDTFIKWIGGKNPHWNMGSKPGQLERHRWEIGGVGATNLIKQLLPYLIIKKPHAILFLEFRKTFKGKLKNKDKEETQAKRLNILRRYRELMGNTSMFARKTNIKNGLVFNYGERVPAVIIK